MRKLKTILLILFALKQTFVSGQEGWTLRMALDTATQKNLGLQISRNEAKIAANNSTAGEAGMLPRLDVYANTTRANNDIRQEFRTGEVLSTGNVKAENTQASATVNWTIFDGFRMFSERDRLKIVEALGGLYSQQQLIDVLGRTARAYFDLQRQQLLVEFTRNGLALYEERVNIAKRKLDLGSAPKTEWLQAKVDMNEQLSVLTVRKASLDNARAVLNGLLIRPITDSIIVMDSISVTEAPNYEYFLSRLEQGNLSIQEQVLLMQAADKQITSAKSYYYPILDLNAGYNYSISSTTQGFFLENRNMGPVAGLTLNWNLFNGNVTRNDVRNAKLISENARLSAEQVKLDVNVALRVAWQNYAAALEVYNREHESNQVATSNLDITSERFRLGESDVLELREAQSTKEDAQSRLANAYYEVRIALVQLLQLTGEVF